ncbi:hypothetical protein VTO73DRAFT_13126 [Trametes versicolor]
MTLNPAAAILLVCGPHDVSSPRGAFYELSFLADAVMKLRSSPCSHGRIGMTGRGVHDRIEREVRYVEDDAGAVQLGGEFTLDDVTPRHSPPPPVQVVSSRIYSKSAAPWS